MDEGEPAWTDMIDCWNTHGFVVLENDIQQPGSTSTLVLAGSYSDTRNLRADLWNKVYPKAGNTTPIVWIYDSSDRLISEYRTNYTPMEGDENKIVITAQNAELYTPGEPERLKIDVIIGRAIKAGLCSIDIKLGGIHAYSDDLSKNYASPSQEGAHRMKDALAIIKKEYKKYNDGGSIVDLPNDQLPISSPSPVVQATNFSFSQSGSVGEGSGVVRGVVNLSGTIKSGLCDIVEGSRGTIDQVQIYLNDDSIPIATWNVNVNKGSGSAPRRFPYSGSYSGSVLVDLVPCRNTITIIAKDKIYGRPGSAKINIDVNANGSTDITPGSSVSGGLASIASPYYSRVDFAGVDLASIANGTSSLAMQAISCVNDGEDAESANVSGTVISGKITLASNTSSFIAEIADVEAAINGTVDTFSATVQASGLSAVSQNVIFRRVSDQLFESDFYALRISAANEIEASSSIDVTVSRGSSGLTVYSGTLVKNGEVWVSPDSSFSMSIAVSSGGDLSRGVTATFSSSAFNITSGIAQAVDVSSSGSSFSSANIRIQQNETVTWSVSAPVLAYQDNIDNFCALALQVDGPEEILKGDSFTISTLTGNRKVIEKSGKYYMADKDGKNIETLFHISKQEMRDDETGDPMYWMFANVYNPCGENELLKAQLKFLGGFVRGFVGGGGAVVTGTLEMVAETGMTIDMHLLSVFKYTPDFIARHTQWMEYFLGANLKDFGQLAGQEAGDRTLSTARGISDAAVAVGSVVLGICKRNDEAIDAVTTAILTGDRSKLIGVSEENALILELTYEVIASFADSYFDADPFEQGKIMGRVVFEVAALAAPFAKGEMISAATKAAVIQSIITKLKQAEWFKSLPNVSKVIDSLNVLVEYSNRLGKTDMCFIAGTPIKTEYGWKPIEEISVGDYVLSTNPIDGSSGYKRVLATVITHPSSLYHIKYHALGDGPSDSHEIACTGGHPFWVSDKNDFITADKLCAGDCLLVANGGTAIVTGVSMNNSNNDDLFVTYNFEVSDNHTYYAGSLPVLVHNKSDRACEQFFSIMERIGRKLKNLDPHTRFQAALAKVWPPGRERLATADFVKSIMQKLRTEFYSGGLVEPRSMTYAQAKGIAHSAENLQWQHWWPKAYLPDETIYEAGQVFEIANPFSHRSRPYGMDLLLDDFLKIKCNAQTVVQSRGLFKAKSFAEQKALLQEFYEGLGYRMPSFTSPGRL